MLNFELIRQSLLFQGGGVPRTGGHPQEDDQESQREDERRLGWTRNSGAKKRRDRQPIEKKTRAGMRIKDGFLGSSSESIEERERSIVRMTKQRRPLSLLQKREFFPVPPTDETVADDLPGASNIMGSRRAPKSKWNPMLKPTTAV